MQYDTSENSPDFHLNHLMIAALEITIKLFETNEDETSKWSDFVSTILRQHNIDSIDDLIFCKSLKSVVEYEIFIDIDRKDEAQFFRSIRKGTSDKVQFCKEMKKHIQQNTQIVEDISMLTKIMYFVQKGLIENKQSQAILLALALITQDKQKKYQCFQRLSEKKSSCVYYLISYADCLISVYQIKDAIDAYNKGVLLAKVETNSTCKLASFIYLVCGRILAIQLQIERGIQSFKKSLKKGPQNSQALKQLIYAYLRSHKYALIKQAIQEFKKLRPESLQFSAVEAMIQCFLSDKIKGQQLFNKIASAIKQRQVNEKDICLYHFCLGIKKYFQLQYEVAYQYLLLQNKNWEKQIILLWMERCCFKMHKYQLALQYSRRLVQWRVRTYHLIILDYICLNEYKKAIKLTEQVDLWRQQELKFLNYNSATALLQAYSKLGYSEKVIKLQNNKQYFSYQFVYKIQIQILLFINHERLGNKQQAEAAFEAAYNLIQQQKLTIHYFEQFHQTLFLVKKCFERSLLQIGRKIVSKLKMILDQLRKYSQTGAKFLQDVLTQNRQFDIEILLHF